MEFCSSVYFHMNVVYTYSENYIVSFLCRVSKAMKDYLVCLAAEGSLYVSIYI